MKYTRPKEYQRQGYVHLEKFGGRSLVAWDMGLGKSFLSLLWRHRNPEASPAIVVSPASLKYNWAKEASKHFNMNAVVLEGRKPRRLTVFERERLIIINYDILAFWVEALRSIDPKLIIGDEIHFIKEKTSKRSKAMVALCKDVPHILALSGTPMTNRPRELWPTLHILWPKEFRFFRPFGDAFCAPRLTRWGWKYDGACNVKKLNKTLLQHGMTRLLKKDVLTELPDKQRIVQPLDIKNRKEYELAERDFIRWLRMQDTAKAARASKAIGFAKTEYILHLTAKLKMPFVMDWIDNFFCSSNSKLLLFAIHKDIISTVMEGFKRRIVKIDGSVKPEQRLGIIEQFEKSRHVDILIGNIKAMGVGNSIKNSHTAAFLELAKTPADHTQAEDRIYGLGRGVEGVGTTAYYLVASDTIEERYCNMLQKKQKNISAAIDGVVDSKELNLYDMLLTSELRRLEQ